MKLLNIVQEGSSDLERVKKIFIRKWKKIMKPKTRKDKLDYDRKLIEDILTKEEVKFL